MEIFLVVIICVIAYGVHVYSRVKERVSASLNAAKQGAIAGVTAGIHSSFMRYLFETIKDISSKVHKKIYLNDKAIAENKPADIQQKFDEICDDVKNYFFNGTEKIISTDLKQKYPALTIRTHESVAKLLDDTSLNVDVLNNVLDDYRRICNKFLKEDLIRYVEKKYEVRLSFDENGEVVCNS